MAKERFVETYSQGVTNVRKIIVDTETGVNYLLISSNMTTGCGIAGCRQEICANLFADSG